MDSLLSVRTSRKENQMKAELIAEPEELIEDSRTTNFNKH